MKNRFFQTLSVYLLISAWLPLFIVIGHFKDLYGWSSFDFWDLHWFGKLIYMLIVTLSVAATYMLGTHLKNSFEIKENPDHCNHESPVYDDAQNDEILNYVEEVAGKSIFSFRSMASMDGSRYRIEFNFLDNPNDAHSPLESRGTTLQLDSRSPIGASVLPDLITSNELGWFSSDYIVQNREPVLKANNDHVRELFIKLWDAAGTTYYEKEEWEKLRDTLIECGYSL